MSNGAGIAISLAVAVHPQPVSEGVASLGQMDLHLLTGNSSCVQSSHPHNGYGSRGGTSVSRSGNAALRQVQPVDHAPEQSIPVGHVASADGISNLTVAAPDLEPDFDAAAIAAASASVSRPTAQTESASVLAFPASKMREPAPEPSQWARSIMQATLEALHGVRPTGQLRRWYAPRVHAAVTARAACGVRVMSSPPKIIVRSVRTVSVGEGRIEASGVFEIGGRCRAIAMRMQTYDGRWRVTALEIG